MQLELLVFVLLQGLLVVLARPDVYPVKYETTTECYCKLLSNPISEFNMKCGYRFHDLIMDKMIKDCYRMVWDHDQLEAFLCNLHDVCFEKYRTHVGFECPSPHCDKIGPIASPNGDPCEECKCVYGEIYCKAHCKVRECPPVPCDHPIQDFRECCPKCCEAGDKFQPDPCTFCTCGGDGIIACVGTPLSVPFGCPQSVWVIDQCGVPHCPECTPGDIVPSERPCNEICTCNMDGTITCIEVAFKCFCGLSTNCECEGLFVPDGECCARCPEQDCNLVDCADLTCPKDEQITEPGACCPRCLNPGCTPGDSVATDKPCEESCFCNDDGTVTCHQLIVDCFCGFVTTCECEGLYVPEGECCPVCPEEDCTDIECPPLFCSEEDQVTEPGLCCPRCDVPLDCSAVQCLRPDCPPELQISDPGDCCATCPEDCTPGTQWEPDPCTFCQCEVDENNKPFELCAIIDCARPPCQDYFVPEGECCPRCPSCEAGDRISSDDPCNEACFCNNQGFVECAAIAFDCVCGFITTCQCEGLFTPEGECCPRCPEQDCTKIKCPQLFCSDDNQITEPGACCPRCLVTVDCSLVLCGRPDCPEETWVQDPHECCPQCPEVCVPGTEWQPDPCTFCSCESDENGKPFEICAMVGCLAPDCDDFFTPEGECCPRCPEICVPGTKWQPDPCTFCSCILDENNNPSELCAMTGCPPPGCDDSFVPEGECCPVCPACVPGTEWQPDPCTFCSCETDENGKPFEICAMVDCLAPDCDDLFTPEGECCPRCPDICVLGTEWQPDPCTFCSCVLDENNIPSELCVVRDCAAPQCDDYFVPEGECCPQCPECVPGTEWQPDPCTFCSCDVDENGNPFELCVAMDCGHPPCDDAFVPEGECCPRCPDCVPGTIWQLDDCNYCSCSLHPVTNDPVAYCTRILCSETCTPGEVWKPDTCNQCKCVIDPETNMPIANCTLNYCPNECILGTQWSPDEWNQCECILSPFTNTPVPICTLVACVERCTPGTKWQPDACNHCECVVDKKTKIPEAVCTLVYCPEECVPGVIWKPDRCNTCECVEDEGTGNPVTMCTLIDCPDECVINPTLIWMPDPCTHCICVEDHKTKLPYLKCRKDRCRKIYCSDAYVPDGKCCPVCPKK